MKTNNPNGRPKGVPNKISADLRQRISDFLNNKWASVETDFDTLEPKERLMFFERLLQYSIPKQKEVTKVDIGSLTDEEVDQLLDKALNKMSNEK
ncbi:hypothetical protein GVN20_05000 [Runella sp. CRIBMP]|uniref:hypothetical protein n=1 Tax=Runella sp. CRIBMP TaxID=2683261 RepID=UPI00141269AA|nr:hypothetical protein [Runella sp. CRIBMP]NBB18708.1 hypothetical protein [Runella sp. CRIBMP]